MAFIPFAKFPHMGRIPVTGQWPTCIPIYTRTIIRIQYTFNFTIYSLYKAQKCINLRMFTVYNYILTCLSPHLPTCTYIHKVPIPVILPTDIHTYLPIYLPTYIHYTQYRPKQLCGWNYLMMLSQKGLGLSQKGLGSHTKHTYYTGVFIHLCTFMSALNCLRSLFMLCSGEGPEDRGSVWWDQRQKILLSASRLPSLRLNAGIQVRPL